MISEIGYTSSIESVVNYHQTKIKNGVAEILQSFKVYDNTSGQINASFRAFSYLSDEKKPYSHISLNFHPDDRDKLTNEKYKELASEYLNHMGYKEQPYVLIKHTDQDHPHVHIITTSIQENGTKIPRFQDRYRSQNISRALEKKHNLTIVSSVKQEQNYQVNISNKSDLKNYLRSSVKAVMALKPKREQDFINTLRNQYQIDVYKTKSKGVSFHIFEKDNGIKIQHFNGYGVKGLSGSAVGKEYSYPNIKTKLQDNFANAPKRYRNLKATEESLVKTLAYFSKVSITDAKPILEAHNITLFKQDNQIYTIDTKGKNLYAQRDLKAFKFGVLGDQTILNPNKLSTLFYTISEEAFYKYKQDISPYLKESVFVDEIALEHTFLSYLETSDHYERFAPFFTEKDQAKLTTIATKYFSQKSSDLKEIQKSEEQKETSLKGIVQHFAAANSLSGSKINDLMEFIDIKDQYTQHSAIKHTVSLIELINEEIQIEKGSPIKDDDKLYVRGSILFDHQKYFTAAELSADYLPHYEKIVSEAYIKSSFSHVKSHFITPQNFIEELNKRGIKLHIESNENGRESIKASLLNMNYTMQLRGVKDFIIDTLKTSHQVVEQNLKNLAFTKALDNAHAPSIHYLYKQGGISLELSNTYEASTIFKEQTQIDNIKVFLNEQYYEFRRSFDSSYESDFLVYFRENQASFSSFIGNNELVNSSAYPELYDAFVTKKLSPEYLNEVCRKEKEKLTNKIKLTGKMNEASAAMLLGVKINDFKATDFEGKYSVPFNYVPSEDLIKLQQTASFKYYAALYESAAKKIFYKQSEFRRDPAGVIMYDTFKSHIPSEHRVAFEKVTSENYINHYLEKISELKLENSKQIESYLKSRGINVYHDGDYIEFSLAGGSANFELKSFDKDIQSIIKNSNISSSMCNLNELPLDQINFNLAIENENYDGAAYLLYSTTAEILFTPEEEILYGQKLDEAINKLAIKTQLNEAYFSIFKASEYYYESDFLEEVYNNTNEFKSQFSSLPDFDQTLYKAVLQEFLSNKLGIDYLAQTIQKEEDLLLSKLELAQKMGSHQMAALLGVKQLNNSLVSDTHGKYTAIFKMQINSQLKKLQEEPYFDYYAKVFEKASKAIFENEAAILDPNGILVFESFKSHIPKEHHKDYLNEFTRNYIQFYTGRIEDYKFSTNQEKVQFLNSKGIRIISNTDGTISFRIVNYPEHTIIKLSEIDIQTTTSATQINYMREAGMLDESTFFKQVEFNNAIETENYMGVAWLLKKGEARNTLSSKEMEKHGKALDEALKSITPNTLLTDILMYSSILSADRSQKAQYQKGKGRFKKKKRRRRL